jgi:hypothetical protein
MERKFKSKLVAAKAADVRKHAIVQLKESIELVSQTCFIQIYIVILNFH